MSRNHPCSGCRYLWRERSGGTICCDYLRIMGHRRPCKPGAECTVKQPGGAVITTPRTAAPRKKAVGKRPGPKAKAAYIARRADTGQVIYGPTTARDLAYWAEVPGVNALLVAINAGRVRNIGPAKGCRFEKMKTQEESDEQTKT